MSRLIVSRLVRLDQTWKLSTALCSNQVYSRALSTRANDRLLLNNFPKVNQTSIRFAESDKSNKPTESDKSAQANETNEEAAKDERFSKAPKRRPRFLFTWRAFFISTTIGGIYLGAIYYFKKQKETELDNERTRSLGKAAIGGLFELVDTDNKPVSNKDFLGKWVLIYFGFSHCPDVCPDEIEKMVQVYHRVKKANKNAEIVPLFISIDPDRDTPEIVKKYCAEFSPDIIGLTGTREQVKAMCKNYRVYYSPGPKSPDKDYIVDHTIIMYLINPDGDFVDYYGQTRDAEMVANAVLINMRKFKKTKTGSWW